MKGFEMGQAEFLKVFNDLEQTLQNKYDTTETIYDLLEREKDSLENNPVKMNWEILDIARRLRNILAHETKTNLPEIATPSQQVMDVLKKVTLAYQHPRTIQQFLSGQNRRKILSFQVNESLKQLLRMIHQTHYSQFPIFDQKGYVGLVSNAGITSWLAAMSERDSLSFLQTESVKIWDILHYEEHEKGVVKLHQDDNLFHLLRKFADSKTRVVLICQKKNLEIQTVRDIVGIITRSDVVEITEEIR